MLIQGITIMIHDTGITAITCTVAVPITPPTLRFLCLTLSIHTHICCFVLCCSSSCHCLDLLSLTARVIAVQLCVFICLRVLFGFVLISSLSSSWSPYRRVVSLCLHLFTCHIARVLFGSVLFPPVLLAFPSPRDHCASSCLLSVHLSYVCCLVCCILVPVVFTVLTSQQLE